MNILRRLLSVEFGCFMWINIVMSTVAIVSTCQSSDVMNERVQLGYGRNFEPTPRYSRSMLYSLRASAGRPDLGHLDKLGLLYYRGTRAGRHVCMRRERFNERVRMWINECDTDDSGCIRRVETTFRIPRRKSPTSVRVLTDCVKYATHDHSGKNSNISITPFSAPNVYIINPTSLAKPNAIDCLKADISSLGIGVVMISETWLKKHHDSRLFSLPDFNLFRHDRERRRGGGVAIYAREELNGTVFQDGDPE